MAGSAIERGAARGGAGRRGHAGEPMNLPGSPSVRARVRRQLATLRHYHKIAEVGEIARRYFAMNAFDGVLTTIGVLVGGYFGGVRQRRGHLHRGAHDGRRHGRVRVLRLVPRRARRARPGHARARGVHALQPAGVHHRVCLRYATVVIALVDGRLAVRGGAHRHDPVRRSPPSSRCHTAYLYLAVIVGLVELFFLGMLPRLDLAGSGSGCGPQVPPAGIIALAISLLLGGASDDGRGPAGETTDHPLLAGLNDEQRKAVTHGDGPAADPRGGRLGQDARAHPPGRPGSSRSSA